VFDLDRFCPYLYGYPNTSTITDEEYLTNSTNETIQSFQGLVWIHFPHQIESRLNDLYQVDWFRLCKFVDECLNENDISSEWIPNELAHPDPIRVMFQKILIQLHCRKQCLWLHEDEDILPVLSSFQPLTIHPETDLCIYEELIEHHIQDRKLIRLKLEDKEEEEEKVVPIEIQIRRKKWSLYSPPPSSSTTLPRITIQDLIEQQQQGSTGGIVFLYDHLSIPPSTKLTYFETLDLSTRVYLSRTKNPSVFILKDSSIVRPQFHHEYRSIQCCTIYDLEFVKDKELKYIVLLQPEELCRYEWYCIQKCHQLVSC
jgi:hypothetical protein